MLAHRLRRLPNIKPTLTLFQCSLPCLPGRRTYHMHAIARSKHKQNQNKLKQSILLFIFQFNVVCF